jgi:hypothetical protein
VAGYPGGLWCQAIAELFASEKTGHARVGGVDQGGTVVNLPARSKPMLRCRHDAGPPPPRFSENRGRGRRGGRRKNNVRGALPHNWSSECR